MIDTLLEKNLLPDRVIRIGIRRLLARRLRDESARYQVGAYVDDLKRRPVAENTAAANEQHYEVPAEFYRLCLGPRLKYSGCLYPTGRETLGEAELAMLELYVGRARLEDGQDVLELGCGWGSLSLFLAERFPRSRITGVSNSRTQKAFIDAEAARRGLGNLTIVTRDMNVFEAAPAAFDRVVSVEMFEHMKNYRVLLAKVARWLRPGGLLFVHIFTHRELSYHFVPEGADDWMARYFFTGGQMPAHRLLESFQDDLAFRQSWMIDGTHYQKTAEHWLENMDRHREEIMEIFRQTYGPAQAVKWWAYWRVFYMSCAELWGYRQGTEWLVSHYVFEKE